MFALTVVRAPREIIRAELARQIYDEIREFSFAENAETESRRGILKFDTIRTLQVG